MNERYQKNIGLFITEEKQQLLFTKKFTIIGCGGNGEYFADFLVRLGVKQLILFDEDSFEFSNINRQIFYNSNKNKAIETATRLRNINPEVDIKSFPINFNENYLDIILNSDMIIYCGDYLYPLKESFLNINNIPILIQGITSTGIKGIIFKQNKYELLKLIDNSKYIDLPMNKINISQPAFMCALSAAFWCIQIIKYFTDKNYKTDRWIEYNLFKEFPI